MAFRPFESISKDLKEPPKEPSGKGLIFGAIFCTCFTLAFDGYIGWGAIRQVQAMGFAKTPGLVTESRVEERSDTDDDGTSYSPKLTYKYHVAGKEYEGHRYRFAMMSGQRNDARRIVAQFPVGRRIDVFYSLSDPATSVLKTALGGADFFGPLLMMPFAVIAVGLWMLALGPFFRRLLRVPAGGARIVEDGYSSRVRLAQSSPLFNGAIMAAVVAFLSIFVIGFSDGFDPPLHVMYVDWGVILGTGIVVYFVAWLKIVRGKNELIIDDARGRLTLPVSYGRTQVIELRFKSLRGIEVEPHVKRDSEGNSWTFAAVLVFTGDDNSPQREKLAEYHTRARATELVEWLRDRLRLPAADQPVVGPKQ